MRGAGRSHLPQYASPARPSFPVPALLPSEARTLLPWARRYSLRLALATNTSQSDAWDETISALVRAAAFFRDGSGSFTSYAKTAVARGLNRYCARGRHSNPLTNALPVSQVMDVHPSPETLACLCEDALGQ